MYDVVLNENIVKKLKRLDKNTAIKIYEFIEELTKNESLQKKVRPLKGNLKGFYKYKPLKDYRILSKIENEVITIFLLDL